MLENVLFVDIETTGLVPKDADWKTEFNLFPHVVELCWCINGNERRFIIRPDGWAISPEVTAIHGISHEQAIKEGAPFDEVITEFVKDCHAANIIVGHNVYFDISIIKACILKVLGYSWYEQVRAEDALFKGKRIDTMKKTMKFVGATFPNSNRLKFPKLEELHMKIFGESFPAHSALEDVRALIRCVPELVNQGIIELKQKEYPAEVQKITFDDPQPVQKPVLEKKKTVKTKPIIPVAPIVEDSIKLDQPAPPIVDPELKGLLDVNDENF